TRLMEGSAKHFNASKHLVGVRAAPIDAAARRAHREPIVSEIDKRSDFFEHRFLVDAVKRRVAFQATRKHVELFELKSAKHLPDLLLIVHAFDQERPRPGTPL